jgi:hypothetical protein
MRIGKSGDDQGDKLGYLPVLYAIQGLSSVA